MKHIINKIKHNRLSEEEEFILNLITDLEITQHKKFFYYNKGDIPFFEYLVDDKRLYCSSTHIGFILSEKYKTLDYVPIIIKLFGDYHDIEVCDCMVIKDRLFYCNIL